MVNLIVFNNVAAKPAISKVDGMVRHALDKVVTNNVAVTYAKKYTRNILVEDPTVVDVIVLYLIVNWMMWDWMEVLAPYQDHSARSRMANLVMLYKVPSIVVFKIDTVATDCVKMVFLKAAVFCAPHKHNFAAVFPARRWEHSAIAIMAFAMHIVSACSLCEGEARDVYP
jgi:hypothetical protein